MKTVGDWVALAAFLSLVALGWLVVAGVGLAWWQVAFAVAWWLVIGILAGVKPEEWKRRER